MFIPRLLIIITLLLYIRAAKQKDGNHCFFENRTYRVSDTWHSKDHCLLFSCEKDQHNAVVSIYSKICPKQPDCIPSDVYVKACCRYCKKKDAIVINKEEKEEIMSKYSTHPCKRTCDTAKPPMDCFYNFKLETFEAFGNPCYDCPFNLTDCTLPECIQVDGISRSVYVINRMMPGPAIEVCQHDRIIVDVQNELITETTSIHWHGIRQIKTKYMDGVQFLTQCPVLPSTSFQYTFEAETAGTYFWHSHAGLQRSDGLTGALIIRKPKQEDLHGNLYDIDSSEYIVFVQDWIHATSETMFTSFYYSTNQPFPITFLVNGKGRYLKSFESEELLNKTLSLMPFEEFNVKKGFRYRFRVINGGFYVCPVAISVDSHDLLIISTDGHDIEPVVVESLVINAGERFDFVINANQSIDNYWIRFKGLFSCEKLKIQQQAILRYEGAGSSDPTAPLDYSFPTRSGIQLSTPIVGPQKNNTLKISQLQSLEPSDHDDLSARDPDYRFIIGFGLTVFNKLNPFFPPGFSINSNDYSSGIKMTQLNHISFKFPSTPLLSQLPDNVSKLCNETSLREQGVDCENEYCHCVHVEHVKLNSIVEIVLFDHGETIITHPIHLHGYSFQILGMDYVKNVTRDKIINMAENDQLRQNYNDRPPIKDTVAVPSPGYSLIRFRADNAGYWLLHCHFEFHLILGMGTVFKVGEYENWFPPPENFPKC